MVMDVFRVTCLYVVELISFHSFLSIFNFSFPWLLHIHDRNASWYEGIIRNFKRRKHNLTALRTPAPSVHDIAYDRS